MKTKILPIIIFSLFFGGVVFAQDAELPAVSQVELPDPGMTPDSPFYFLKTWKESIQTFFTFGAEKKAKQYLHLAEVRLAEYEKMVEKEETEIAAKTLEKYERQLNHALEKVEEAKEKGNDVVKIKEEISEKIIKHQEVLENVLEKVPENAKKGIERAIESSQKGFEKSIEAVTGEKKEELERKAEKVKIRIEEKGEAEAAAPKEKLPPQMNKEVEEIETEKPAESIPSEIRYYTCPDGTKVESGKCNAGGSCVMQMSPELQCPAPTPPVTAGESCQTLQETKYYQCFDDQQVPWCVCGPSNRWKCTHLPELSCSKPTSASVSPETVACCFADGSCNTETKEQCLAKGATVSGSSCSPNPCKATTPISTSKTVEYEKCSNNKVLRDYKCSDGTVIDWKCDCISYWPPEAGSGYSDWTCVLDPEKLCSVSNDSLAVVWMSISNYGGSIRFFWKTNRPTTSYLEYGVTTAYGVTASGDRIEASTFDPLHVVEGIQVGSNTTYHFRIVAQDANGNKFISDDYTFITE